MYLSHITSSIAENKKPINDFFQSGEISFNELQVYEKIMGLKHVPREAKSSVYMQLKAVMKKLSLEYPMQTEKIKYVFFAHTGDMVFPLGFDGLKKIENEFGLTHSLSLGSTLSKCSAAFQFFKLSNALFNQLDEEDCILLLVADSAFTETLSLIPGTTIMGDAATAIILRKRGEMHRIIDVYLKNFGEFAKGIWADEKEKLLFQKNYVTYCSDLIRDILFKNNLEIHQIACIFPHNVNLISWRQIIHALSLKNDQVYLSNIEKIAHCFGSDPFLNLKSGIEEKRVKLGDYYLLVTMGLGATFGVMLFQY